MKTMTKTAIKVDSSTLSIAFAALLGLAIIFAAGFANSGVIHNSAHDTRHAIGFACH